jgi:hypothetical protein
VKTVVMSAPRIRPRRVSSLGFIAQILHPTDAGDEGGAPTA